MTTYEYRWVHVEPYSDGATHPKDLNTLGAHGWRVVPGIGEPHDHVLLMERALPESPEV